MKKARRYFKILGAKILFLLILPVWQSRKERYKRNCSSMVSVRDIDGGRYLRKRIPNSIALSTSKSLRENAKYHAGCAVRFTVESPRIGYRVLYRKHATLKSLPLRSSSCIEFVFNGDKESRVYIASNGIFDITLDGVIEVSGESNQLTMILPTYATVHDILLFPVGDGKIDWAGLDNRKSLVVYGSSITQGCAASSPGRSYANLVGEALGFRVENYGFSESARGEAAIAEYISKRHGDIYVLEYDHNASLNHLRKTHFNFYKVVRESNPKSLIVVMSRFSGRLSLSEDEEWERIGVVFGTYAKATEEGDKNIVFIDGSKALIGTAEYFDDGVHPNDKGMSQIANVILSSVRRWVFDSAQISVDSK